MYKMKSIISLVFCIGLGSFCAAEYTNYRPSNQRTDYNAGNEMEWSGYSYSIDEGHCGGTKLVDEDVRKDSDPNTYKKTTYTWTGRGMFYLTCIRVLNRMSRDKNAAEARITEGGVGEGQVRIEMRSQSSQRIDYHIEIWGKDTRQQASNVAILTHTPNSVLYMNGKKYCECH